MSDKPCRDCQGSPELRAVRVMVGELELGYREECAACEGSGVAPPLTLRELRDAIDAALLEGLSENAPVVLVRESADGRGCTTSQAVAAVREGSLSYGFHIYGPKTT